MTIEKGHKDSAAGPATAPNDVPAAPLSDIRLTATLTDVQLRAFMGRPETQARIREVVRARLKGSAPSTLVDDLAGQANLDAFTSKSRPRSVATASGWLATLTARAVVNHFRRQAVHAKYLEPVIEVEELPSGPDESNGASAPTWVLAEWLAPLVAGNPRDQETYELLVYKAHTGKTHALVAADHGMTEGALKSRIRALKEKYEPQWRRRKRLLLLMILFGVAAVIAALAWLLSRPEVAPNGSLPAPTTPILDRVSGNLLPVSHPPPDGRGSDGAPDASH